MLLLAGSVCAETDPPKIVANIGDRTTGERTNVVATIENDTNTAFSITEIRVSCGCLKVTPSTLDLGPGSKMNLRIDVDGIELEGAFKKGILIRTTRADQPLILVDVVGKFTAPDHRIQSLPASLSIDAATPGKRIQQVVKIRRAGNAEVGEITLKPSSSWIKAEIVKSRSSKTELAVMLDIDLPRQSAPIDEEVVVAGANANDFIRIPVKSQRVVAVSAAPAQIAMKDSKLEQIIKITRQTEGVGNLVEWSLDVNDLEIVACQESRLKDAMQSQVSVHLVARKSGFVQAELRLKFQGEETPLKIPIAGVIPQKN
jgi:hypothetical protein